MTIKQSPSLPPPEQNTTKYKWLEGAKIVVQAMLIQHAHESWDDRLSYVLTYVLDNSPPEARLRTTLPHPEAMKLVQGNSDLKKALEDTVQSCNYESLLSLSILQADYVQMTPSNSHSSDLYHSPDNLSATFKAFMAPYVDGFPKALLKTVDKYSNQDGYNQSISIIQSSGTGKSRGMAETAQIRFSFLFNLRQNIGPYAYPPPDDAVREYLTQPGSGTIQYRAFLCSLFENAPAWIPHISSSKESSSAFAKRWYDYLNENESEQQTGPNREKFYQTVVEAAKRIVHDSVGISAARLEQACSNFVAFLRERYKCVPTVVCLLIFDEAQELVSTPKDSHSEERDNYDRLGSVLSEITQQPVFSVFLSTNTNVRKLAPPVHLHPSHRVSSHPDTSGLHPPFTELPFDVFARNLNDTDIQKHSTSLSKTCTVPVMVRFGRPLWYSLHDSGYAFLIEFAKDKLNPKRNFPKDKRAQFACLAIRIGLDFDASREIGRIREAEHVASYMRIVFAVPKHREYMRTGTPSEPVLAEAAAQLLNAKPDQRPLNKRAPIVLRNAFEVGFLARGERGEMVGRLLWTLAHDEVVRGGISNESGRDVASKGAISSKHGSDPVKYHKPIRVLDFLHSLFHKDHWKTIDEAKPIGRDDGKSLAEAFGEAYISFSHFMDGSNYDIDLHNVYRLLLRGAALNCQRNQPSVNFLTPILFGDPDSATLDRSCTSVLQAQIKNRDQTNKVAVDPTLVGTDQPVLSLVHHLGTPSSSVEVMHSLSNGQKSHPYHYQIVSHGCTSKTFGVIPSSSDVTYPLLLGSDLLMDDFSRTDIKECMSLFRQLQPCTGLERALHEQSKTRQKKQEKAGVREGDTWSWFWEEDEEEMEDEDAEMEEEEEEDVDMEEDDEDMEEDDEDTEEE